jgi:FMN phosphatase YigB (HAD superfamily)
VIEASPNSTREAREVFWNPAVRLVAIDLRGTLLKTPRVTTLVPEMRDQGVPRALAQAAQSRFDRRLRGPLQKRGDILDWTMFAARSMAAALMSEWRQELDASEMASAFQVRYLRQAERLIDPEPLRRVVTALPARFTIVADGPYEREASLLRARFGASPWMPPLTTSECLGVNKLTSEFFARLANRHRLPTRSIVVIGDRWDKDVAIPRLAGCHGLLVGSIHQDLPAVSSLRTLLPHSYDEVLPCAA